MAGFLDPTYEAILTGLPDNFGIQTRDFVNNVLKGLYYASMSVVTRTVTGQVKKGDGTNYTAAVSVNLFCDQAITVNVGTTTTIGNSSIQITTNASGVFQVTIAGSQGATLIATVTGGVGVVAIIGSGGTGGGFGGGGGGGGTVTDSNYGDITVSGTGTVWTVNPNVISLGKLAQVPTATFLGRITAGTGNIESLTAAQATSLLNTYLGTTKGLVPAGSNSTTLFLREDGTWSLPVPDGDKGDITVSGGVWTIDPNVVSFSKLAQITTDRLLGRDTAGTGNIEELTVSGGLEFTGSTGIQRSALTGDISAAAGSNTTSIGNNKVLDTMIRQSAGVSVIGRSANSTGNVADISASADNTYLGRNSGSLSFSALSPASISTGVTTATIMGRVTAGTGALEQLTGTQATTLLDPFTTLLKGVVPAPGTATGKFLKDDATWATPGMTIGGSVVSGTAGSILFVATGPVLAQNNAAFFWENTNKVLKITQSAADPLDGTGAITLQNTLSTSLVQISWRHNTAAFIASLGHNNAAGLDGGMYFDIESSTSAGLFITSSVGGNHMQIFSGATNGAGFQLWNGTNTVVSDANTGRLRYNPTGQKFQVSLNGGAYLDLPALATTLTTGSVLFADSAGRIAQDNADFKYDPTNNKLAIGTSAVSNTTHALDVSQSISGDTPVFFWNTSTSGYSGLGWNDSTPVYRGSMGYGNSAVPITTLRNLNFFASAAVDYVFCDVSTGVNVVTTRVSMTGGSAGLEFSNGSSWAAAAASLGRLRYNTTGQKFQVSANTVAFKDIGLLAAALTTGSVPFSDSTGSLAQDNTNLFWDNTNKRLSLGAGTSPAVTLTVKNTTTAQVVAQIEHTAVAGYAAVSLIDSAAANKGMMGYGNASVALTHLQSKNFLHSTGPVWAVSNATGVALTFYPVSGSAGIGMADGASLAVSAAGEARIRYNAGTDKLQISKNGAAYIDII